MSSQDFGSAAYGSMCKLGYSAAFEARDQLDQFARRGEVGSSMQSQHKRRRQSPVLELSLCFFLPLILFIGIFWMRSFHVRYEAESFTTFMSYACLCVPIAAGFKALSTFRQGGDAKPLALLAMLSLLACLLGFLAGNSNYHANMQHFFDVKQLNVYPSVDPSLYGGQQLMDAGIIQFTPGSKLLLEKSMGFKNGDTYCAAPIVSQTGNQTSFDFWAVGTNCCSGHTSDFQCGEYGSRKPMQGLRLLDSAKRDMFQLVVKKAEVSYNIKAPHPILLYWLSDPQAEISAYQDDGWQHFVSVSFAFSCTLLVIVAAATMGFAKL